MVTSRDVARLAGVSQPTVSRALRDSSRVSAQTKSRVREAAVALGYVPSETGRALSSGRTLQIGLLLTDLDNQFYPHIIAPVHAELAALGYQLMLHTESTDTSTVAERLIALSVDGVLLATTTIDSVIPVRLRDRGLPFAYFNRTADGVEADSVTVDPSAGIGAAATKAHELGHRRIGAIFGPRNTSTAQSREAALREALADRGLTIPPRYARRGPFEFQTGWRATAELLDVADPPTVIFCGNDVVAYGALNAAHERGVRVPEQLSIIGFDDLPAAGWPIIELTTIAFDLDAMARRAAQLLVDRITAPDGAYAHPAFESSLVLRQTLGPAPVTG